MIMSARVPSESFILGARKKRGQMVSGAASRSWLTADGRTLAHRRLCHCPQSGNTLASILQRSLDVARRGAAGDIVQREHFSKSEAGGERRVKARVDRLQVGERQFLQFASAFQGQLDSLADRFVGEARGHS